MFKRNTKFDADLLLCSLHHFECNSHTVHMITQWHLLPPLTSTVNLSLFTQAHSSPLSLATRLHRCSANHSCYINNGWTVFLTDLSYKCYYIHWNTRYHLVLRSKSPNFVFPRTLGHAWIIDLLVCHGVLFHFYLPTDLRCPMWQPHVTIHSLICG